MTVDAQNPAAELKRMIVEGDVSEDTLQTITGIQPEKLLAYLDQATPGMMTLTTERQSPSNDESTRLSIFVGHLTVGLQIGDDDRLKAIFETLTVQCHLTVQNIAQLTGLSIEDLDSALRDPRTVPIEKKYELAIRGSHLINAVNQARGQ
jgi:hypothetical protein